jgi:pimeloyl-ACP methyl ester carboxylesterase
MGSEKGAQMDSIGSVLQYDLSSLAVTELGQGEPLLLIHGWGRSGSDLRGLGEHLARQFRVLIVDLPGFGGSAPPPEEGWNSRQFAALLHRLLSEMKIARIRVIGHSVGGRIALRLAQEFGESVAAIGLIGSHGLVRRRSIGARLRIAGIRVLSRFAKFGDRVLGRSYFRPKFGTRFGSPDYLRAGVLKNTLVKIVTEDQTPDLGKVRCPTLLIWGDSDTETPLEMGQRFHALISDSRLVVLKGQGHDPYLGAGAGVCAHHLLSFFEGQKQVE